MPENMQNRERLPNRNNVKVIGAGPIYGVGQKGMNPSEGKFKEYTVDISGKRAVVYFTEKKNIFILKNGKWMLYNDSSAENVKVLALPPLPSLSTKDLGKRMKQETETYKKVETRKKEEEEKFWNGIGAPRNGRSHDELKQFTRFLCFNVRSLQKKWAHAQREGRYRLDPYEARNALHEAGILPAFLYARHKGFKDQNCIPIWREDAAHYQRFDGKVGYRHPREAGEFHESTAEILDFYNEPSLERVLQKIVDVEIRNRRDVLAKIARGSKLEPDEAQRYPDLRSVSSEQAKRREIALAAQERGIRAVQYYLTAMKKGDTKTLDLTGFFQYYHFSDLSDPRLLDYVSPLKISDERFEEIITVGGNAIELSNLLQKPRAEGGGLFFATPELWQQQVIALNAERIKFCDKEQEKKMKEVSDHFLAAAQLYVQKKEDEGQKQIDYKKAVTAYMNALQNAQAISDLAREKEDRVMQNIIDQETLEKFMSQESFTFEIQRKVLQLACYLPRRTLERNPGLLQKVTRYYANASVYRSLSGPEQKLLDGIVSPEKAHSPLAIVHEASDLYKKNTLAIRLVTPEILLSAISKKAFFPFVLSAYHHVQACILQNKPIGLRDRACIENNTFSFSISDREKIVVNILLKEEGTAQWICTLQYPDQTKQTFTLDALFQAVHTKSLARESLLGIPAVQRLLENIPIIAGGLLSAKLILADALNNTSKSSEGAAAAQKILLSLCRLYERSEIKADVAILRDVKKFLQEHKDIVSQIMDGDDWIIKVLEGINESEGMEEKGAFQRLFELVPGITKDTWGKVFDEQALPFIFSICGGVTGGQIFTKLTSRWAAALAKRGAVRQSWLLGQASPALGLGVGMYATGEAYAFVRYYGFGHTQFTPEAVQYARGYITRGEYFGYMTKSIGLSAASSFVLSAIGGPLGEHMRRYLARHNTEESKTVLTYLYENLLRVSRGSNWFEEQLHSMIPLGRSKLGRLFEVYWKELCEESSQDFVEKGMNQIMSQIWAMILTRQVQEASTWQDYLWASGGYLIGLVWMLQGKDPKSKAGVAPLRDPLKGYRTVWMESGTGKIVATGTQKPNHPHCFSRQELASVHYFSTYDPKGKTELLKEAEELLLSKGNTDFTDKIKEDPNTGNITCTYTYRHVQYTHEWQPSKVPAFIRRVYYASCDEDHRSPLDAFRFALHEDTGSCSVDRVVDDHGGRLYDYFRYQGITMIPQYDQGNITHYMLHDESSGLETVLQLLGSIEH